jgi:hypothetical protein
MPLPPRQITVLRYLSDRPSATTRKVSKDLLMNRDDAQNALQGLTSQAPGISRRERAGRVMTRTINHEEYQSCASAAAAIQTTTTTVSACAGSAGATDGTAETRHAQARPRPLPGVSQAVGLLLLRPAPAQRPPLNRPVNKASDPAMARRAAQMPATSPVDQERNITDGPESNTTPRRSRRAPSPRTPSRSLVEPGTCCGVRAGQDGDGGAAGTALRPVMA